MTRSNLGFGFKRYTLKLSTGQPTAQQLSGFDRGYGLIVQYGAPYIESIEVYAGQSSEPLTLDPYDFRDGWKIPVPGGFKKLVVNLKSTVTLGASRVVLDVYTVPGMIETRSDPYQGFAARRIFESTLHTQPGGSNVVALAALGSAGDVVKVCEVIADRYQGDDGVGYFPSTGNAFYASRFFADEGSNLQYPTPSLYFDGWISSNLASTQWKVWIMACRIDSGGDHEWVVYRELSPVLPATTVPVEITQDGGLSIVRLENTTLPMAIPPDGFQIWVENLDVNAKQLRGCIAGRTA